MHRSNKAAWATVALAACAVAGWCACTSTVVDSYSMQTIEVGYGETCGDIQNEPGNIQAECESGINCQVIDHSYPDGGLGLALGLCAPSFATCPLDAGCASGFDCTEINEDNSAEGVCEKRCVTAADCLGPFQTCPFGHCHIVACLTDPDCNDPSAHCSDHLCVRGDASTR